MNEGPAHFEIRELKTQDEFISCVALERDTWGQSFSECVPPAILMINQKVGGVTAGAFDSSGELVGFVFGLTGIKSGRPIHWSHMLAVRPEVRNKGIGTRLKLFQKEQVAELGVETIYWTFDPLVAKNAHINLNHLGTEIDGYVQDMYIASNESDLHRGLSMDRFVVKWDLKRELGKQESFTPPGTDKMPIVNTEIGKDGSVEPIKLDTKREPRLRIEIPNDILKVQMESQEMAGLWRKNTREAFQAFLDDDYIVETFYRDQKSERCFYVLARPPV